MNSNDLALRQQLIDHEGLRTRVYTDTVGKLTIGVGRNLSDVGITHAEAIMLLDHDLSVAISDLEELPGFAEASPIRQRVLIDMRFNLGPNRFRTFTRTLAAFAVGDYKATAAGMRASKWARQTGRRAKRLAIMMETDRDPGPQ